MRPAQAVLFLLLLVAIVGEILLIAAAMDGI